jgi:uncharacterized membrane protein YraQ (UPF0718 family)
MIISFTANRQKTKKALMKGAKMLWMITPAFVSIILSVSIVLYFIPNEMIIDYLGGSNSYTGVLAASIIGSITVIPGPIVYPLCQILLEKGVSYSVIAAFSSSLMMVGVLSFPVEVAYFGKKFAALRNITSLLMSLIIALFFSLMSGRLI